MKKLFLSILGMLFCSIMALAVPVDSALTKIVTVSSDKVKYTIVDDENQPWNVNEAGEVESTNHEHQTGSSLKINFACSANLRIVFDYISKKNHSDQAKISIINYREIVSSRYSYNIEGHEEIYLSPGEYTLDLYFWSQNQDAESDNSLKLKNLNISEIDSLITSINVTAPGTLGNEVLAQFPTLPDVKCLKIKGSLNKADFDILKQMSNLRVLNLSETKVTEIPARAFENMSIRFFTFPNNLKKIGEYAFSSNQEQLIGELLLPESLEEIGSYAFRYADFNLCKLPAKTQKLGEYAFADCHNFKEFIFTSSHREIPNGFLYNCRGLKKLQGTDSIKVLHESSVSNCSSLYSLGNMQPEAINSYACQNNQKLEIIDLSKCKTFGYNAFHSNKSLTSADLKSARSIGAYAFSYCEKLSQIEFRDLISINDEAFRGTAIKSIVIPDKTTNIGRAAFFSCDSLLEITLGSSYHRMKGDTFRYCPNIKKIICKSPTPLTWEYENSIFEKGVVSSATLVVPDYAMVSYKLDPNWSKFTKVETHSENVNDLTLSGTLDLTTNARIPGTPNMSQSFDSHFSVNGENPQTLKKYIIHNVDPRFDSNQKPATMISRCSNVTADSVHIRTHMRGRNWYNVCYPFDIQMSQISTEKGTPFVVRYYDGAVRAANGAGQSWVNVPTDGTLKANQGYIVQIYEDDWFLVKATDESKNRYFNSQAMVTQLNEYASESSSDRSWNYIGNPYPAYFDIYHIDYSAPITVWSTYNRTYTAYSIADDELALLPMQGFFVQKPEGVASITFHPEGRQTSATIDHSYLPSPTICRADNPRYLIDLNLSNGQFTDRTRIVRNLSASDAYETEIDAAKMMSTDMNVPQIYSWTAEADYAINEGPQADDIVNLGIYIPTDGTYTLSLHRGNMKVELIDLLKGKTVDLSEPYVFTAGEGEYENRFCLRLKNDEVTGVETVEVPIKVVPSTGGIRISGNVGSKIQVFTMDGRAIAVQTLHSDNQFMELPAGLYIVEINGEVIKALVH